MGAVGFPELGWHRGSKARSKHFGDDHGRPPGPGAAEAGHRAAGLRRDDRGFPDCPPGRAREEMTAREPGRARREGRRPE